MPEILCYGDSNTYGFNPENGFRYTKNERWTGVLASLLGNTYKVIEEGCNNRTMYFKNVVGLKQSGCDYFPECIKKYNKIDWVILGLGANDTQFRYDSTAETFRTGLLNLIQTVKQNFDAKIIILSPSIIKEAILKTFFSQMFDESSIEKSKIICDIYKEIAEQENCYFLDLNQVAQASDIDGLHYTIEAHKKIAEAVKAVIL